MERVGLPFLFLALSGVAGAQYAIGPNVQVSAALSTERHYETYVGSDVRRAGHLIACAYVVRAGGRIDNVVYVSFDRGRTWAHTLTVEAAVDPSCATGGGAAWAAGVHDLADATGTPVLSVYRSGDGGRTWKASSIGVETQPSDRVYLTADAAGRRVYVHAYRYSRTPPAAMMFFPSADGGRSFARKLVSEATTFDKPWFFPGNGVVAADGSFFAIAAELDDTKRNLSNRTDAASAPAAANGVMNVFVSGDGGKTFGIAGRIAEAFYDWRTAQLSMPALAVDRRGSLYAVWPDARYERRTQILFAASHDRGRTWSVPRVVSEVGEHGNHFMPAIAVNREGVVGISWYDRRDSPDNIGYRVRFAASVDGGATWLPSAAVATAAHTASDDARKNSGDTAGLAADAGGVFHPVWIDNRTGVPQMWTATVKVRR